MGSLMNMLVGMLVVETISKVIPVLNEIQTNPKRKEIIRKLDRMQKRHNPGRFTMMKAKRSCS